MTIPVYDPMQAYNYGVFVENAYQMFAASPGSLTPPVLPIFPSTYELVLYLTAVDHVVGETESKFFGFVARSQESPSDYVVAIRGTEHLIEWLIDAEFRPTKFSPVPPAGDVEDGFFSIYRTLGGVLPNGQPADLREFIGESAGKGSLTIAGHSLGAALAIMLALDVTVNSPVETLTLLHARSPQGRWWEFQGLLQPERPSELPRVQRTRCGAQATAALPAARWRRGD